jgi:hypothetical protein
MVKKKLLTTRLYALYKSLEIALQRKQEVSNYENPRLLPNGFGFL